VWPSVSSGLVGFKKWARDYRCSKFQFALELRYPKLEVSAQIFGYEYLLTVQKLGGSSVACKNVLSWFGCDANCSRHHSFDPVEHLALHAMLDLLTTYHQLKHFVHRMLRIFLQTHVTAKHSKTRRKYRAFYYTVYPAKGPPSLLTVTWRRISRFK